MKRAPALLAMFAPLMLGGCFGSATPWDRPWVDFGCEEPGVCRVRGVLEIDAAAVSPHGRLMLDDGRCLAVDLAGPVVRNRRAWDGRRVSVRGRAVARAIEGPCGERGMLLYAERVSLKGGQ